MAGRGHRIGTGFLGTPLVCDALTGTGHVDTAYRLLTQRSCPSWLYQVDLGATTVWERWDSMLDDGNVNPGEMTSFNHYALGAVADWIHRTVAGLAPAEPGYRRLLIRPRPGGGLTWARAEHDTPTAAPRPAGVSKETPCTSTSWCRPMSPRWSTCPARSPSRSDPAGTPSGPRSPQPRGDVRRTGSGRAVAGSVQGAHMTHTSLPDTFLWGVATAGHQNEGHNTASDTWFLEHTTPSLFREPSGAACQGYQRWETDLDLAAGLGLNAFRFSVEWARVEPERGVVSAEALDHYERKVDGCLERGMAPLVTFNHFSSPHWFAAAGSWTAGDAPERFAEQCDRVMARFGDRIAYAVTLNEPNLEQLLQAGGKLPAEAETLKSRMLAAAARAAGSDTYASANVIPPTGRTSSRRRSPGPIAPPAPRSRPAAATCPSASPSPSPTKWRCPAARSAGTPSAQRSTTTGCARPATTTSSAYRTTSASSTAPTAR